MKLVSLGLARCTNIFVHQTIIMKGFHLWRWQSVLLLIVLLSNFLRHDVVLAQVDSEEDDDDDINGTCELRRMQVTFKREGCNDVTTMVKYCTGACKSFTTPTEYYPERPLFYQQCTCCSATTFAVRKRTLSFNCIDSTTGRNTTVVQVTWLPRIDACGCTACGN